MSKDDWKAKLGMIGTGLSILAGVILHYTNPTDVAALTLAAAATKLFLTFGGYGFADKLKKIYDSLNK